MKSCFVALLFTLLMATGAVRLNAKPNFSGEWVMNRAQSDFGRFPMPDTYIRKIEQNGPNLKITTTQSGRRGAYTTEFTYTTDGKECTNTVRGHQAKGTANWEGDQLVIHTNVDINGNRIAFKERWTLSPDGKTLTVNARMTGNRGAADFKITLDRQ